ncbi:ABC transporter ATP-binding protein [Homoserinibacter sp. YIM 151385]|uniref:ABC transporter ATP-binding protein n=1 Tax=Homoserinibacter sp. YIM 151385 TaxID=2985506 RepID=UPI0022F02970|nr:ABC transporter ATP-binding protein [Homoserinibacter sp. YIM 151385]WBU38255.1 ABC transporter ATP-binding protein [Homoserinibacter sp. YIM 151385]
MTTVIELEGVTKRYRDVTAVDDVTLRIEEHRIVGLLGRNGAGKTTLMSLLTGQEFATAGDIRVFGETPVEHAAVLQNICFIKESQRYPEDFQARHVLRSAPWFFANWDADFAEQLIAEFRIPLKRPIKKLSRGQLSAIGVVIGLASRAPLTFFDEPYLGLDAVARQIFYDRLIEDYAEHPRTIVLSTHLIDEVAELIEHVLVIDDGRIVVDEDAESLRGRAVDVVGSAAAVDGYIRGREILHREGMGGLASATLPGLTEDDRRAAAAAGLTLAPVSLQQLVVRLTSSSTSTKEAEVRA